MATRPEYPFEPRSTSYLVPGQFWALPLSDGRYACGRVLAVPAPGDPYVPSSRMIFLAGLMDWSGDDAPTSDSLAGAQLLANGFAHIRAIRQNGRLILGHRPLDLDGVVGLRAVSHRGGGTVYLYEGATRLRAATTEERSRLPVMRTWGYDVISIRAERRFVQGLPLADTS